MTRLRQGTSAFALLAMVAALQLAATAGAQTRPLAEERSASPRVGLGLAMRLGRGPLSQYGHASPAETRAVVGLSPAAVRQISQQARTSLQSAEALVREAYAAAAPQREALLGRAQQQYGAWESQVRELIKARELENPVYKEWARKTWEALLVQSHAAAKHSHPQLEVSRSMTGGAPRAVVEAMKEELYRLSPARFREVVEQAWQGLYGGARSSREGQLLATNPLVLLPRAWGEAAPAAGERGTVSYRLPAELLAPRSWGRKSFAVRDDIAFVWVPGVARTYTEFETQQRTLLESGVLSLRAKTGSWKNPYRNAFDVAAAINEARRITRNPSVKVVLVGYSQGNNSTYSFLQSQGRDEREAAMFRELRGNVVQVYDLDSAARGTPMADLGVVLTKIFTGRSQEIEKVEKSLRELKQFLTVTGASKTKQRVLGWLMGHRREIDRQIKSLTGRTSTGPLARARARLADSVHDLLVGGLESLTTSRGKELMTSAALAENLRHIPVVNTVGVVPRSRPDLVPTFGPLDQTPGWRFMLDDLGMANDYQVPEKYQRLEPVLPGAVDLPKQAIGHWGITGIQMGKTHNAEHFKSFSPALHTYSMVEMMRRMGL